MATAEGRTNEAYDDQDPPWDTANESLDSLHSGRQQSWLGTVGVMSEDQRPSLDDRPLLRLLGSRTHAGRLVPHPGPVEGEQDAARSKSGALRAAIFGMNDGLVSNLSLIFGVAGSGVHRDVVVIAGIAGLLAGAFSMAAGEYISMKVQREVFEELI